MIVFKKCCTDFCDLKLCLLLLRNIIFFTYLKKKFCLFWGKCITSLITLFLVVKSLFRRIVLQPIPYTCSAVNLTFYWSNMFYSIFFPVNVERSTTTSERSVSNKCSSWTVSYSLCTPTGSSVQRTPQRGSPPASCSTATKTPL